jgi:hypothetical protein
MNRFGRGERNARRGSHQSERYDQLHCNARLREMRVTALTNRGFHDKVETICGRFMG